ncbi:hypothetical protein EVA_08604 [gut metagenome]|uniref:Uncharacterized protein n=1 Tax=gut metagenome TaxID=749906 RepID=J9G7R6_9ZZZZ
MHITGERQQLFLLEHLDFFYTHHCRTFFEVQRTVTG